LVPCAVWSERFNQSPDDLIAATSESPWRDWLLDGWTRSAARQHDAVWSLALWRYWLTPSTNLTENVVRDELHGLVAPFVPIGEREAYAASYFTTAGNVDSASFDNALSMLPTPWTPTFGHAYLAALRAFVAALDPGAKDTAPWDDTPSVAALNLPPACFEAALEPLVAPESDNWHIRNFRGQLGGLVETIRLRKQLYEEIPQP
jgi:hypothetical protein